MEIEHFATREMNGACHAEILAEDTEATELADYILIIDVISRQG
jgi:hypothetical protein